MPPSLKNPKKLFDSLIKLHHQFSSSSSSAAAANNSEIGSRKKPTTTTISSSSSSAVKRHPNGNNISHNAANNNNNISPSKVYHLLGYMTRHGLGTQKNLSESLKFTKISAQMGNVDSMFAMSRFASDIDERRHWLEQAALGGAHNEALLQLAELQKDEGKIDDAMVSLIRCARRAGERVTQGRALYQLALLFLEKAQEPATGDEDEEFSLDDVEDEEMDESAADEEDASKQENLTNEEDAKMAVKVLKEAITIGNLDAMCTLGDLYMQGLAKEIKPNAKLAFKLYRGAAEKGHGLSQYQLYRCMMEGIGMDKKQQKSSEDAQQKEENTSASDSSTEKPSLSPQQQEAIEWLQKAAENNVVAAQCELATCLLEGEAGLEKNPEKAFQLLDHAAKMNDVDAQVNLAYCYHLGLGCEKDDKKAFEWFYMAAMHGLPFAQYQVGLRYENGEGVPEKDISQAFQWYRKAADHGQPDALNEVGRCYEKGIGVSEPSPFKAFTYYNQAAEQGHFLALVNVAKCYIKGIGVHRDLNKALEACEKCAEHYPPAQKLRKELKMLLEMEGEEGAADDLAMRKRPMRLRRRKKAKRKKVEKDSSE